MILATLMILLIFQCLDGITFGFIYADIEIRKELIN